MIFPNTLSRTSDYSGEDSTLDYRSLPVFTSLYDLIVHYARNPRIRGQAIATARPPTNWYNRLVDLWTTSSSPNRSTALSEEEAADALVDQLKAALFGGRVGIVPLDSMRLLHYHCPEPRSMIDGDGRDTDYYYGLESRREGGVLPRRDSTATLVGQSPTDAYDRSTALDNKFTKRGDFHGVDYYLDGRVDEACGLFLFSFERCISYIPNPLFLPNIPTFCPGPDAEELPGVCRTENCHGGTNVFEGEEVYY
ncbi:hypothetical protein BJ085DRAFT_29260 [Dimargaris cristalligena]|uniref:Uncharacterized protein n=1 Tax=Dimargaris cristalligena TaxID=215637 RepID=A0A4P9ZT02_9FUNG|nr:hypothetical protein BJ085DRAFT_29260 [Dimargaris cristalligena]|eukprot:RKP36328.1 hypothetical protein BJ085DRAFT_29260 [Dimargaris cristalligena]